MNKQTEVRIDEFLRDIVEGQSDEDAIETLEEISDRAQSLASARDIETNGETDDTP